VTAVNVAAVHTEGLRKVYGGTEAVVDLDLAVPSGIVFGFLGPNGAGKSTTIGMLCTLLRPTAGHAEVAGFDVVREAHEVRRRIGLVFQETTLDLELTADQNLSLHATLFGLPRRYARDRITALLGLVDLLGRRNAPVGTYSAGMRRRLEIARGLLHTPEILFLDEPTTGLDPQTRAAIWEHVRGLRRDLGITTFLTTHQLEEAENCDRLAIIDHGEIVVTGRPAELKAVIGADLVTLRTGDDARAARMIRDEFRLDATADEPDGVRVRIADGAAFVPRICAQLPVSVHAVTVTSPTLDDVFLHYTGRTIRESAETGPARPAAFRPRRPA
jgi:ABC-2 type transport system ATP-binding protein